MIWDGHPFEGGKYQGSGVIVGPAAILSASHVFLQRESDQSTHWYVFGKAFSAPAQIEKVFSASSHDERSLPPDIAVATLKFPAEIDADSVVNIFDLDTDWIAGETNVWICGSGDPAMPPEIIKGTYSTHDPRTGLLVFKCQVASGMSGGSVSTKNGLCGVVKARHVENDQVDVVPIQQCTQLLRKVGIDLRRYKQQSEFKESDIPLPLLPSNLKTEVIKKYPLGPALPSTMLDVHSMCSLLAKSLTETESKLAIINANKLRLNTDPKWPEESLILQDLPSPFHSGLMTYWFEVIEQSCIRGPRMVIALLLSLPLGVWEKYGESIIETIEEVYKNE